MLDQIIYLIFNVLLRIATKIFFRSVTVNGRENIPRDGAVIFVGNHQNQFMDPLLITVTAPRRISFLIAAVSMKRKVVGQIARVLRSIPVMRPQDYKESGEGLVSAVKGEKVIYGKGTRFVDQFNDGQSIYIKLIADPLRVVQIVSQEEMIVSTELPLTFDDQLFSVYPRISQENVYDSVWGSLRDGNCIGIFPEGGSHDRTELLELKAGVTLMALGAMEKYDIPVYIVPCGLNYFSGHRFRGSVLVEYGHAYRVPDDLVDLYRANKREACGQLLSKVAELLHSVLAEAPDYETLQTCMAVRKFYTPSNLYLSPTEYLELQRRFVAGFLAFKDEPQLKSAHEATRKYLDELEFLGLKDEHIADESKKGDLKIFFGFLGKSFLMLMVSVLFLPAVLMNLPVGLLLRYLANQEAKKALAKSTVKIKAQDTLASVKVVYGAVLLPLSYCIYSTVLFYYFNIWWSILFFVSAPFLSYISMLVAEQGLAILNYFYRIAKMKWGNKRVRELRDKRKKLVELIREIVDIFGPKLFKDFNKIRVVKKDQIANDKPLNRSYKSSLLRTGSTSLKKKRRKADVIITKEDYENTSHFLFENSPL